MDSKDTLLMMLSTLATGLPTFIVDVVLIAMAVAKWNKHPQVSMYAAGGGSFLLLLDLLFRSLFVILPMKLRENGMAPAQMSVYLGAMSVVGSLLHAVAMGLLIAAIFSDRGEQKLPLPR
ncbi:MAG: hypothetical protein QM817_26295 [Archangium sp.]